MRRAFIILAAIAVIALCMLWWVASDMTVDGCLDNGGRWNGQTRACEPPVPADWPRG